MDIKINDEYTVWGSGSAIAVKVLAKFSDDGKAYVAVKALSDDHGFYYGDIDVFTEDELSEKVSQGYYKFKESIGSAADGLTDKQLFKVYAAIEGRI